MQKPLNIFVILGTRPEAIKLSPVVLELQKYPHEFSVTIVSTGQHKEMLAQALNDFNLKAHINLELMTSVSSISELIGNAIIQMSKLFIDHSPHFLLVQGDTTTTLAGALAAFYCKIPFAHIEAGLRSHDMQNPYPEEGNRKAISALATLHFPPTQLAYEELIKENISKDLLAITGNTVVDSVLMLSKKHSLNPEQILGRNLDGKKIIFVTTHRRESWGEKQESICQALYEIAKKYTDTLIVLPMHPNPKVRETIQTILSEKSNICLLEPLDYNSCLTIIKHSYLVLTDSGGIQEEAPTFGVPVLVLRSVTERPEAVQNGMAKLIGTEKQNIINEVGLLLEDSIAYAAMAENRNPFGDGNASKRIVKAIQHWNMEELPLLSVAESFC